MCKVLTQSKDRLLDVSNTDIYIEQKDKHIFNICVYRFNRSVVLGTYRTEEYTKFVMDMIGGYLGQDNYYKMPEIDDLPQTDL